MSAERRREISKAQWERIKADPVLRDMKNRQLRETNRKRNRGRESWPKYIISQLSGRAKKRGLEFNISVVDIVIPNVCPIRLTPFVFNEGHVQDNSPSIDRIDNDRGYVKGNVRVISYRANAMKNNCTDPNIMRRLADYMEGLL